MFGVECCGGVVSGSQGTRRISQGTRWWSQETSGDGSGPIGPGNFEGCWCISTPAREVLGWKGTKTPIFRRLRRAITVSATAYSSYKFANGLSIFRRSRMRIRIQYINWLRNNYGNQKKRTDAMSWWVFMRTRDISSHCFNREIIWLQNWVLSFSKSEISFKRLSAMFVAFVTYLLCGL